MSLDYSIGKIPFDVRYERITDPDYVKEILRGHAPRHYVNLEEGNEHGVEPGVWMRTLACETLIWATMTVDLGRITAKNWMKFYSRLHAYEQLFGPHRRRREEDGGDIKPVYFTPEEVRNHIGLSTNVADMTDTRWWKKLRVNFDSLCERACKRN